MGNSNSDANKNEITKNTCDNMHCSNFVEFEMDTWDTNFILGANRYCDNCAHVFYEENYSKSKTIPKFARVCIHSFSIRVREAMNLLHK